MAPAETKTVLIIGEIGFGHGHTEAKGGLQSHAITYIRKYKDRHKNKDKYMHTTFFNQPPVVALHIICVIPAKLVKWLLPQSEYILWDVSDDSRGRGGQGVMGDNFRQTAFWGKRGGGRRGCYWSQQYGKGMRQRQRKWTQVSPV